MKNVIIGKVVRELYTVQMTITIDVAIAVQKEIVQGVLPPLNLIRLLLTVYIPMQDHATFLQLAGIPIQAGELLQPLEESATGPHRQLGPIHTGNDVGRRVASSANAHIPTSGTAEKSAHAIIAKEAPMSIVNSSQNHSIKSGGKSIIGNLTGIIPQKGITPQSGKHMTTVIRHSMVVNHLLITHRIIITSIKMKRNTVAIALVIAQHAGWREADL